MSVVIGSSMIEFLATTHAITANFFGNTGEGASKIKYVVDLIM